MKRKILIFGGGFVGLNLAFCAKEAGWEVYIADCIERAKPRGISWIICDITSKPKIKNLMEEINPDYIVNVAAIADIDKAEKNKELAYSINVEGALNIAEQAKRMKVRYLFFSSDAVFNGSGEIYFDEDKPDPVNYYGYTKAAAENEIIKIYPDAIIVRVSLILGLTVAGGNSFFESFVDKLKNEEKIICSKNEIRTPIDIYTLCETVILLLKSQFKGIFNIGSKDHLSRFELSKKIASLLGYNEDKIIGEEQIEISDSSRAKRHKNGIISVFKIEKHLQIEMPDIDMVIKKASKKKY